jgi:hypothetical protein
MTPTEVENKEIANEHHHILMDEAVTRCEQWINQNSFNRFSIHTYLYHMAKFGYLIAFQAAENCNVRLEIMGQHFDKAMDANDELIKTKNAWIEQCAEHERRRLEQDKEIASLKSELHDHEVSKKFRDERIKELEEKLNDCEKHRRQYKARVAELETDLKEAKQLIADQTVSHHDAIKKVAKMEFILRSIGVGIEVDSLLNNVTEKAEKFTTGVEKDIDGWRVWVTIGVQTLYFLTRETKERAEGYKRCVDFALNSLLNSDKEVQVSDTTTAS